MTPETAVYLAAGGASGLIAVALLVRLRRIESGSRSILGVVAAVMGVAAVTYVLTGFGLGTLVYAGGTVLAPLLVNDLVAYPVFFVVAGVLAGASRTHLLALGGVSVAQRLSFELASVGYLEGSLALVAASGVVVGWFVHAYLLLGPVWTAAQDVPDRQRLLHWKCRNLLLFLVAMLIVFGVLILGGVFDLFVVSITNAYLSFLVRAGLAGFVFANAGEISGEVVGDSLLGGRVEATRTPAGD